MALTTKHFLTLFSLVCTIIASVAVLKKWHLGLRTSFADLSEEDLTPERITLLRQIQARQQEISSFYFKSHGHQSTSDDPQLHYGRNFTLEPTSRFGSHRYIGCSELSGMTVVDFLGAGYTKMVLKVLLSQGVEVALKTVNDQGSDMRSCMKDFRDLQGCQDLVSFKLRKEIILLQRLQHPNIVKVLSYKSCILHEASLIHVTIFLYIICFIICIV